jgi:hypothetical protein
MGPKQAGETHLIRQLDTIIRVFFRSYKGVRLPTNVIKLLPWSKLHYRYVNGWIRVCLPTSDVSFDPLSSSFSAIHANTNALVAYGRFVLYIVDDVSSRDKVCEFQFMPKLVGSCAAYPEGGARYSFGLGLIDVP